jgi:enediyne biosynthesis protein E4
MSFRAFFFSLLIILFFLTLRCSKKESETLFKLLPPSETGIEFKNELTESDSLNILNQANIYNGGGVGIGDFNQDGLADVYFASNMVSNKLYVNKGSMKFEDVTELAMVGGMGHWCTGVSVVDINADGRLDIYVSASFRKDKIRRTNLLYINQGNNVEGIPMFKESAASYGLADTGFSTQGVFFDYDKDGDLDVYVLTNELNDPKTLIKYRPKVVDGSARNTDRLYRNNGNETFTNVSYEAGILIEGWGHAVCISDINLDGWPDIYIGNDFVSNDLLYINNRDGTFTNCLAGYVKHSSWNAMGTDAVDINNDGWVDLISLEMLPEDNLRKKTMLTGDEYFNYFNSRKYGYEHQYVRNTLQLNRGMTPEGHPVFSEIAQLSGVYQTDWSWTPLVADFDNDGLRDMIITNGLPRDVTDLDYIKYNNGQRNQGGYGNSTLAMTDSLPVVKIASYAFRNTNGLLFSDSTKAWGFTQPAFSNGGAYADLDNDGDLDVVVNNLNDYAFVYENTLQQRGQENTKHHLTVMLKGNGKNVQGVGATVRIYYANKQQVYEHQPVRGYLSTVDAKIHFGLGATNTIDSLWIQWAEGKQQVLKNVKADHTITLAHQEASDLKIQSPVMMKPWLEEVSAQHGIKLKHEEKDAIDYNIQSTLPHKLSQYGPGIAVGDIDGNGFDDFYIGASTLHAGTFFLQDRLGKFAKDSTRIRQREKMPVEEMGVLFFDADNDNDLDLYTATGSYEFPPFHPSSQDALYVNNGKGIFIRSETALPEEFSNGSCVRAADFDQDGDLDVFVGGRSVSGAYPFAPENYLLVNHNGMFQDVTEQYCPSLRNAGMITDALWSDYDQDGKVDLILAGEWMPITFYKNTGKALVPSNELSGIAQRVGWWNSLCSGDFDSDGDLDYAAGNLGLNSNFKATPEEPMTLFAKDLNDDGKTDPMIFCYAKAVDGTRKPFPMHTRDDMISQLITIRRQYPTYKSFGLASMDDLWRTEDRQNALKLQVNHLETSYIENKGNGKFELKPLPLEAQTAPVYGMISKDVDEDGNLDLLLVGNDYGMEPFSGRHDAFAGLWLKGDGHGNFESTPVAHSGFFVAGDAKGFSALHTTTGELLLVTQNQDEVKVFENRKGEKSLQSSASSWLPLKPDDVGIEIYYNNGKKRRVEFYYGSTYLSQSSRGLRREKNVLKYKVTSFRGESREMK